MLVKIFIDVYNSAILISKSYEFYHKTKLVPGAESTPFPKVFDKLSAKIIELGGISGSWPQIITCLHLVFQSLK